MFNIKNFNIDQLHKENNYIINTYFGDLKEISDTEQEENNYAKCDVILNNIPYTMYKSNSFDFDVLLIPKTLKTFKTDFDDIIRYSGNEKGLHFSILRRNNELVELINYDFITNDLEYVTGNYRYDNLEDHNKQLQKEFIKMNCSLENFINKFNIIDGKYKIDRIKRNSKETKLNRILGNSLLEAYNSFDMNFEILDDNETPLLKLLENLEKQKTK